MTDALAAALDKLAVTALAAVSTTVPPRLAPAAGAVTASIS